MPQSSFQNRSQATFGPYPIVLAAAPRRELESRSARPRPVVALGDGSEAALNAAWRAALIAQSWGVSVHLLSAWAGSSGVPRPGRGFEDLPRQNSHRSGISLTDRASEDLVHPESRAVEGAGLLVTHVEDGCRPSEWLLGTRIEQLVRKFSIPVLVVKQPASRRHCRVLVGAKLDLHAIDLVAGARMLAPRARVDVVHVLGTSYEHKLRLADAPEAAVRAHRAHTHRDAYRQMNELITAACGHEADAVVPRLAVGSAPDRLLEIARATRTGLIVLGKGPGHWIADFFLDRGIARRIMAEASSDLLLIPTSG